MSAGFLDMQWSTYLDKLKRQDWSRLQMIPDMVPIKPFEPKYKLPKLKSYEGDFGLEFWSHWKKRTYKESLPNMSWVDPNKLEEAAKSVGYSDTQRLNRVLGRLRMGAELGCEGVARLPTKHKNAAWACEYGDRVCDALRELIDSGILVGPL